MSPLQISMILHYYVSATDFRDGDFSAPAVRQAIDGFVESGMLTSGNRAGYDTAYELTDKSRAYVAALTSVPEPIIKYVVVFNQSQQEGE